MKIKECLWLWGQDAMSHQLSPGNSKWKLPGGNRLEPVEGAAFLGVQNIFRVVMNGKPVPPFDAESEKMKNIPKVIYSAVGDAGSVRNDSETDLEEVIRQAAEYPNIQGAILDDFFAYRLVEGGKLARYTPEYIRNMRHRLHTALARKLDLWVVWYKRALEYPVDEYLGEFDGITYWNMDTPAQSGELRDDLDRMIERTPGKKRMAGCYIWNYGAGRPLTPAELRFECETFCDYLKKGKLDGIIFCSNCCADIGGPAIDFLRGWIREVGEEELQIFG
jgi:hypothetical protein